MSKTTKNTAVDFDKASPELVSKVRAVVAEVEGKHVYSVSRIFAQHNAVFNLKEQPQTCSSCLTIRARNLKTWLEGYDKANPAKGEKAKTTEVPTTGDTQEADTYEGVVSKYALAIGESDAEELATLGTVIEAGSSNMTAGELALVQARYDILGGHAKQEALEAAHVVKLNALGIHAESSDEDLLEALNVLNGEASATDEERALYLSEITKVQARIADANDPNAPQFNAPAEGVTRFPMGDATPIDFTPSEADATKGTVKHADGSSVKTGTYDMVDGRKLAVSVGGKASLKPAPEEDLT